MEESIKILIEQKICIVGEADYKNVIYFKLICRQR